MGNERLRAWAFRMRGGIWTVLALAVLAMGGEGKGFVPAGIATVLLGQALRFWAAGSIEGYRRETVNAGYLVTWGPFSIVRNPLYLGNGLIGLGWSLMSGPGAVAVFCAVFALLYLYLVIPYEEGFLKERFGRAYLEYMDSTPRLVPSKIPEAGKMKGPFETSRLWRSERHSVYVTIIGTILFYLRAKGVF